MVHDVRGQRVDRGQHTAHVLHRGLAEPGQLVQGDGTPGHVLVDEGAQPLEPHRARHGGRAERQAGAHRRGQARQHLQLRLETNARLRGAGRADPPPLALTVHDDGGREVRGVVRARLHGDGGEAGDGRGGQGCETKGLTIHPSSLGVVGHEVLDMGTGLR